MKVTDIKAALQTLLGTIAGLNGRVFVDRERPYEAADLPCVEITFEGAEPERKADHYLDWRARIGLAVMVKAAESARPDTTAEGLLGNVLAKLYADLKLGGVLPEELEFGPIRSEEDAAGEHVVRRLVMEIVCSYTEELYGQATDTFLTAAVQIDMAGPRNDPQEPAEPDGQIDAAATIHLPQ
ncbi:MAG: hypothetical protein AB1409_08180 [Pseudomonadota bacterium]